MQPSVVHDDIVNEPAAFAIENFSGMPATMPSFVAGAANVAVKYVSQGVAANMLH
jgi:hypothetical protein